MKGQTNSIIQISSYSLKLDFSIVKLQKRGISLFSLRKRANECLISEKRVFAHFVPQRMLDMEEAIKEEGAVARVEVTKVLVETKA